MLRCQYFDYFLPQHYLISSSNEFNFHATLQCRYITISIQDSAVWQHNTICSMMDLNVLPDAAHLWLDHWFRGSYYVNQDIFLFSLYSHNCFQVGKTKWKWHSLVWCYHLKISRGTLSIVTSGTTSEEIKTFWNMPGYPRNTLIDETKFHDGLLCVMCKLILRNAVQSMCGHRYCETCVKEKLLTMCPSADSSCL